MEEDEIKRIQNLPDGERGLALIAWIERMERESPETIIVKEKWPEQEKPVDFPFGPIPHWVKCSDRMPELFDFVLVTGKPPGTGEPQSIGIARWNGESWEGLGEYDEGDIYGAYMDIEYQLYKDCITVWMPLPTLPKEI